MTKKNKNKIKNKIKIKIILTLQILSRRFTSLKRGIHLQHDDSMQGALERGEKKKAKTHEQSMEWETKSGPNDWMTPLKTIRHQMQIMIWGFVFQIARSRR